MILELPIMKIAENREYDLIKFLIGNMYSYFYVPNSIYSIIFLPLSKYFPSSEMQTGFSLVLFFIFLMSVIFLFKYNKEKLPVIYNILSTPFGFVHLVFWVYYIVKVIIFIKTQIHYA